MPVRDLWKEAEDKNIFGKSLGENQFSDPNVRTPTTSEPGVRDIWAEADRGSTFGTPETPPPPVVQKTTDPLRSISRASSSASPVSWSGAI